VAEIPKRRASSEANPHSRMPGPPRRSYEVENLHAASRQFRMPSTFPGVLSQVKTRCPIPRMSPENLESPMRPVSRPRSATDHPPQCLFTYDAASPGDFDRGGILEAGIGMPRPLLQEGYPSPRKATERQRESHRNDALNLVVREIGENRNALLQAETGFEILMHSIQSRPFRPPMTRFPGHWPRCRPKASASSGRFFVGLELECRDVRLAGLGIDDSSCPVRDGLRDE